MKLWLLISLSLFLHGEGALQKEHEKPQAVKWMDSFFGRRKEYDQSTSLVNLMKEVTRQFLVGCTPIILYDSFLEKSDTLLLEKLFTDFPIPYIHGQITRNYSINLKKIVKDTENTCVSYILFLADVMRCRDVIGEQNTNRVVIVARSSQWRVYEFLGSETARDFVNLLVIAQSEKILPIDQERPYILYTHRLYVDGIGSSAPMVLSSWMRNAFTKADVNLFPTKIQNGFSGHRFIISLASQPPFTIKRGRDENDDIQWDGIEVRLVGLLAETYNFTTDFREAKDVNILGSGKAVSREIASRKANLGLGGIYVTSDLVNLVDLSHAHSQDCASFVTLSSTALPRYRAIMGPFHWTVWLAVTLIYIFAIFPLALSDKLSLKYLIQKPEEMENMFWYVFGTFTNCFTFGGEASWSKSDKVTTRILVGFYWIFTIITTACYTGSIIAFVTLPIYPETVDTTKQLIEGHFQIGTLDKGGWQNMLVNSTDKYTKKIFKNMEFLPNVESGFKNITKAFFWPYAFLGSESELNYIVRNNFSSVNKRSVLHVSKECFVPYGVSMLFTLNSVYKEVLNNGLLRAVQSGFLIKLKHDVEWQMLRSSTGKLLQANVGGTMHLKVEDRALSLDDTQGMFLLLGAGFLLGGASLISEMVGGCVNFCKQKIRRLSTTSIESNPRSHDTLTPREKLNSIQYSIHSRLCSIPDNNSIQNTPDLDEEIDRIFNLDNLFGECNSEDTTTTEEIVSDNYY
ncbi:PREDICTED: ionotropic receptor 21a [Nicrophorus vespilloides]|uniref:Ionotropic receptor 21a n=1 Tax=Nicrophorus vespilloides TaxID=110193 RepID=A0ABM1MPF5_NICVS|nr:PREDICTED: ionotropic receptor 21a [Nicrophorus vespilloides]